MSRNEQYRDGWTVMMNGTVAARDCSDGVAMNSAGGADLDEQWRREQERRWGKGVGLPRYL